jgi:hypothetical protein
MDLSNTIQPNSDQLDAIDLAAGPRTFEIERISKNNAEQPVNLHLTGFPRPWRPGLSMRRVLVACWGADASQYVGRRVTLFCDPDVVFGGLAVGGTRISALSHIDKPKKVPLLVSRGKSAIFVVQPLKEERRPSTVTVDVGEPAPDRITPEKVTELGAAMSNGLELADRDAKLKWLTEQLERPVKSPTELTAAEGDRLIELIKTWTEPPAEEVTEPAQGTLA